MAKIKVLCDWCGKALYRYPCQLGKHAFCSSSCRSKFLSKKTNPTGYIRHKHLEEYNKLHNKERMTIEVREKLRWKRFGKGANKSYPKLYGRHVHRMLAERMLGRKLEPGEVVHHIDGDRTNYSFENLYVCRNQQEHIEIHRKQHDLERGDAR